MPDYETIGQVKPYFPRNVEHAIAIIGAAAERAAIELGWSSMGNWQLTMTSSTPGLRRKITLQPEAAMMDVSIPGSVSTDA